MRVSISWRSSPRCGTRAAAALLTAIPCIEAMWYPGHYLEPLVTIAESLGGDPRALLDALRSNRPLALARFRTRSADDLEAWLRDHGHLDERPRLTREELTLRALASPPAARCRRATHGPAFTAGGFLPKGRRRPDLSGQALRRDVVECRGDALPQDVLDDADFLLTDDEGW